MGKKRGIRLAAAIGMATGAYVLAKEVWAHRNDNPGGWALVRLTGYSLEQGDWDIRRATAGLPMIAGAGFSMIASKVGLNRYTPTGWNI